MAGVAAANPLDDPDDAAALARYASSLADAVDVALPGGSSASWPSGGGSGGARNRRPSLREAAAAAGERARAEVAPALRELLATDVDAQRNNPLAMIRRRGGPPDARCWPTSACRRWCGMPTPNASSPTTVYDLTPASFADLDPVVHEPGLVWGAAKAHVILRRRRAGGR